LVKVVQWATGNIGARSLAAVIDHPSLELVGLFVHDPEKVGRDAGALCGMAPTGVIATDQRDDIIALGADCVLHMPRSLDLDDICALLAGGSNVVTTCGAFHHPDSLDPAVRERVETACRAGGTSIHSTGSSPGFITEAIPLVLTSIQRRLDRLTIDEFADLSSRDSPDLLFNIMGFGRPPASFDEGRVAHLRDAFGPSLRLLADALSLPLDRVEAHGEVAITPDGVDIAAGTLPPGSVAGMRTTVSGMRNGTELIRFRANWYCTPELDVDWDLQATGWRVNVEGDTPLDVALHFPVSPERMADTTPGYTAHRAVNAVATVCAADPGILTTVDLPQVIAELS
jgi:4-hydroxy-tetrahydrodipicolinate reductase